MRIQRHVNSAVAVLTGDCGSLQDGVLESAGERLREELTVADLVVVDLSTAHCGAGLLGALVELAVDFRPLGKYIVVVGQDKLLRRCRLTRLLLTVNHQPMEG